MLLEIAWRRHRQVVVVAVMLLVLVLVQTLMLVKVALWEAFW